MAERVCALRGGWDASAIRRYGVVAIGLLLAAIGTGCSSGVPGDDSASGPTSSVAASASPTPEASASTAQEPAAGSASGADPSPTTAPDLPTVEAPLDEPVVFDTGITVEITAVEAIEVEAETPGEVSGSALRVTVSASNGTEDAQSLESAVVSVAALDDGTSGTGTTAGEPEPFSGSVEPGQTAVATYVFMLDDAGDRDIEVSVNYAAGAPVAIFSGKAS